MVRKQYRKLLGPYTRTSELGPKFRKKLRKQTHKKLRKIYAKIEKEEE
jgi:hypothetical protein